MDLLASLTSALSQGSALLGGLLSQLQGSNGGANLTDKLFSNLVTETNSQPLTSPQTAPAFVSTPAASFTHSADIGASSNSSSANNAMTQAQAVQAVGDITKVLHTIIALMRQKHNAATSQNGNNSQASQQQAAGATGNTQNTDPTTQTAPSQTQDPTTIDAAMATTTATTDSTSNTPADTTIADATDQTLVTVVAELLVMMQLLIQKLQQTQIATNVGTGQANTTLASTALAGTTDVTLAPTDKLMSDIQALLKSASGQDPTAHTDPTNATQDNNTPEASALLDLLHTVEKNAKQLLQDQQNMVGQNNAVAPTTEQTRTEAAIAKVGQIEADLAALLKKLEQHATTQTIATTTTSIDTTTLTAALPETLTKQPLDLMPLQMVAAGVKATKDTVAPQAPQTTTVAATDAPQEQTPAAPQVVAAALFAPKQNNDTHSNAQQQNDTPYAAQAAADIDAANNLDAQGTQAAGTYNFTSTLSAFRANNGGAAGLPSVVDQVILQMNRSVKNGNDQMSLHLQPGDLGKITVKLSFGEDGKVQGTVTADNPQTLGMLQKDSRSLERALQDAGLRPEPGGLQFNLSGQGQQNNAGQMASGGNKNAGNGTINAGDDLGDGGDMGLTDISSIAETYYVTPTGVNIQV